MEAFLRNSVVPTEGLEPSHLAAHGPEPCASTNSATWALAGSFRVSPQTCQRGFRRHPRYRSVERCDGRARALPLHLGTVPLYEAATEFGAGVRRENASTWTESGMTIDTE